MQVAKGSVGITYDEFCTEQDRHLVNCLFQCIARSEQAAKLANGEWMFLLIGRRKNVPGGGVYEQNGHKWIVMQYALVNSFQGGTNDFHKVG